MRKVLLKPAIVQLFVHPLTEKTLQNLMRQRRSKVEEIKKKTNFNSMVKLFQEYDEPSTGTTSATPLRRHVLHNQGPTTPQPRPAVGPISQPQTPVTTALQAQLTRKECNLS